MKLVRYGPSGKEKPGLIDADGKIRDLSKKIKDIDGAALAPAELAKLKQLDVKKLPLVKGRPRLGPCVANPSKFVAIGLNFRDHAMETGSPIPEQPVVFFKATTCIVGPNDNVMVPKDSTQLDWEVELAVVIGREGRDIPEQRALEHVFGYTCANDVSVRDFQQKRHGSQWFKGKNFDTHCPLGPWIVTADEIPDPQGLRVSSRVNGVTKQDSNTRHMVFTAARIIAELSIGMTVWPGDVIATGTPEGVGYARRPPEFMKVGDVVEVEVERIGVLRNTIIQPSG